jgi:2,3-bisphosphoglycerate-dependent phosphoglycerate mutase
MKEAGKIYIFRHGQTAFNRDNKFTGFLDSKLSDAGVADAKIVAERLKKIKIKVAIHTSLTRSKETLKQVLKFHPECKIILQDDRIIERDYGALDGKTHLEVVKKYGTKKYDLWHRSWNIRPPKGESFADVEKRIKSFVSDLKKLSKKENGNIIISAHGNSIRLLRKVLEKLSVKETCELYIPYDKVYEYNEKKL